VAAGPDPLRVDGEGAHLTGFEGTG
jgi:hypothetical protein